MKKFGLLFLILILAFLVRLYKIDNPIADWHSWRQADSASVARNFYKDGFNPFIPKYDDMSGVAINPVPNLERYRFVEFPIYGSLVFFGYLINGGVNEAIGRFTTILISLGSLVFVFLIAKKYFGETVGFLSALLFGILPYSVYYSRVILPDPLLVFCSLGMFYFLDNWIFENKTYQIFWGLIFMAGAFLNKPTAIFYMLPLIYSFFLKEKKIWPFPKRYFLTLLGVLPFLAWRVWMMKFPQGIPYSSWLLNGTGVRFRPAFYQWIVGQRFGVEILGPAGFFLFMLGILRKPQGRENWLLHLLTFSMVLYLFVFASGNVEHDYYQILIIPVLVIFVSRGVVLLCQGIDGFLPRIWTIPLAILFLFLTIYLPWLDVRGLYQINNPSIVEAGKEADRILPKDAKVLAPYDGDTSFLYQTNRPGLPKIDGSLERSIQIYGLTDMVSVSKDVQTKQAMKDYTVLENTNDFVIIDLTKPKQ